MTEEQFLILDQSVKSALIVLLISFVVIFVYALFRLRAHRQKLEDYFEQRFMVGDSALREDREVETRRLRVPTNHLRTAWRSLLLAVMAAVLAFLLFAFAPLPFLDNFATSSSWRLLPLRITDLRFERFTEGFSLDVEVWNQTQEPMPGLKAQVTVLDLNGEVLDAIVRDISPDPLPAGKAGRFTLRYEENSPFLGGYQIDFTDTEGKVLAHQEGFDVR